MVIVDEVRGQWEGRLWFILVENRIEGKSGHCHLVPVYRTTPSRPRKGILWTRLGSDMWKGEEEEEEEVEKEEEEKDLHRLTCLSSSPHLLPPQKRQYHSAQPLGSPVQIHPAFSHSCNDCPALTLNLLISPIGLFEV